ncbi:hypothetical protein FSP39_004157, partial [Pinctada imbricata]
FKPESLRVYLHILAKFLGFLSGEAKWRRKLRITTDELVAEHKGAKSGKRCSILLTTFRNMKKKYWSPAGKEEYLFLSRSGKAITPSTMSKLVNKEWESFVKSEKLDLPKLTASINRKLAVSALREAEGSRQEQEHLALHMAHNVSTADRYYNPSLQKEARVAALEKVQDRYHSAHEKRLERHEEEAAAAAVSPLRDKARGKDSDTSDSSTEKILYDFHCDITFIMI